MGIDGISSAAGAHSYQGTAKPVREASQPAENTAGAAPAEPQSHSMAAALNAEAELQAEQRDAERQKSASMKDVNEINKIINRNTVAEFGYNEPTNRITIKIKDKETDEVIKEIPSEKALEMLAKVWELAGMLVDEKR